jgi:putative mRNA 3-end processing factor
MIEINNGIHIEGTQLWLDSQEPRELCCISHGHVDHLGSHEKIIATAPTVDFYESRMHPTHAIKLEYSRPYDLGKVNVTLYPSGHILGAAQILVRHKNARILYSGDINLRPSLTAEPIEIVSADILIMEATYGRPDYLFPDRDLVISQICSSIEAALDDGKVPVVVAYSLGKGQEIAKILHAKGYRLYAHNTIFDLAHIYQRYGHDFSFLYKMSPSSDFKGGVVLVPPYVLNSNSVVNIENKVTFYLSGWEDVPHDVDHRFVMSDHADFNELLHYVRKVNPKEVYVVQGDEGFVTILRDLGYKAFFKKM